VARRGGGNTARANGIVIPENAPTVAIDESALVAELERAGEHHSDIVSRKAAATRAQTGIAGMLERAATFRDDAIRLRAQAAEVEKGRRGRRRRC
jgi:hypothetical protein